MLSSKVYKLRKFCKEQLKEDENIEEHSSTMLKLVNQLKTLGEEVKINLIVTSLLNSILDS